MASLCKNGAEGSGKGFTLVEIAVSILVLAVGLVAVLSVVGYGMREAREIIQSRGAINCARSVLESECWPIGTECPINGYMALVEEVDEDRPMAADGSRIIQMRRRWVTLTINGRLAMKTSCLVQVQR